MKNFLSFVERFAEFYHDSRKNSSAIPFSDLSKDAQKECVSRWKSWGETYLKNLDAAEKLTKNYTEKQVVRSNITDIHFACTYLMKRAGKECDRFASDLLLDFRTLDLLLRFDDVRQFTLYFGFRDNGVDNLTYVSSRLLDQYSYKDLYRLDVDKSKNTAVLTQLL